MTRDEIIQDIRERLQNRYIPAFPKLQPESNPLADIGTLLSEISTLEEKARELIVEKDSETRWAKEYFDKWEQAESRLKEIIESRDDWKKDWELEEAMNKKLEERIRELEDLISYHKQLYERSCGSYFIHSPDFQNHNKGGQT